MKKSVKLTLLALCVALCLAMLAITALAVPAAPGTHTDGNAACRSHAGGTLLTPDVIAGSARQHNSNPRRAAAQHRDLNSLPLAVIVIGFSDVPYRADFDWAQEIFSSEKSLAQYYTDMSFGKFTFTPVAETSAFGSDGNLNAADAANDGVIHVTLDLPHDDWTLDYPYYSAEDIRTNKTLTAALTAALEQAGRYLDFSAYDADGDGAITTDELAVGFVAAGYEASSADETYPAGIKNYLWSHAWSFQEVIDAYSDYFTVEIPRVGGVAVDSYIVIAEQQEDGSQSPISTLAHELGHYLGLPDLYDVDYNVSGEWIKYDVNILSLMCAGSWGIDPATGATVPYSFDPWSRTVLGWIEPQKADSSIYTLYTQNFRNDAQYSVLQVPTQNPGEYYLIENRGFAKWDAGIKQELNVQTNGGIVLWHVDDTVYDAYADDNTVNNVDHRPAVMPLFPEVSGSACSFIGNYPKVETDKPFFDSSVWASRFSALGDGLDLPVYGTGRSADLRSGRTLSGIMVKFISSGGTQMNIQTNLNSHKHVLSYVTPTAPTCTEPGTAAYECLVCEKMYADAFGAQEITEPFTVDALGHTSPDADGRCTRCGEQLVANDDLCLFCGRYHTGPLGKIRAFFHTIFYYVARFFGLR